MDKELITIFIIRCDYWTGYS